MIRMVRPWAAMRLSNSCSSSFSLEFKPAAGSSSSSKRRIGGERARDLDQSLMTIGKARDQFVGAAAEADEGQRGHRALDQRVFATFADQRVARTLGADHHILQRRHRAEQPDVLERASESGSGALMRRHVGDVGAVEHDPARGRLVETGEHIQRRGLAGAVRSDQRVNAAAPHRDIDFVDSLQAAEILRQPLTSRTVSPPTVAGVSCSAAAAGTHLALGAPALGCDVDEPPDAVGHVADDEDHRQTVDRQIKPGNALQEAQPFRNQDQQSGADGRPDRRGDAAEQATSSGTRPIRQTKIDPD